MPPKRDICIIAHDIRSTHNVGALLRIADAFALKRVYLTGYTPCPLGGVDDARLPHLAQKLNQQIAKTALGAERTVAWEQTDPLTLVMALRSKGYTVVALEQTDRAIPLQHYSPPAKLALILGSEVGGIAPSLLARVDETIVIPMLGSKESLNVSVAAGIALYHLRFTSQPTAV